MAISTIGSDALDPILGIGTTTPSVGARVTIAAAGNQLYLKDTRAASGVTGLITSNQNGTIYYDANTTNTVTTGGHTWRTAGADILNLSSAGTLYVSNRAWIASNEYTSVNQGALMCFYTYATYGGNQYSHFKTNLRNTTAQMFCIEARGFDYGGASSIAGNWVGYVYSPAPSAPINTSINNWGTQAFCNSMYYSADGYLVLVANTAPYYCSCTFNSYATAQGIYDMHITAFSNTTSATGAF